MKTERIPRIMFVGDYTPRVCGIATFTADLRNAVRERMPDTGCAVSAVTDVPEGYRYPEEVGFEIREQDRESYVQAADFINSSGTDLVSLQHEFGIYGGESGEYILTLLEHLRKPVVTTLHTVLENPSSGQRRVFDGLAARSDRMVVMTQTAKRILMNAYGLDGNRIDVVFHGIPDMPFVDPAFYKDHFGVEGRRVILTFGLLSPNKGIEYVIRALPEIIGKFPDVVYIVLGATHPNLLRTEGEAYRTGLRKLASDLGVSGSVIFRNRFVTTTELVEYIGAADVYITPYLNREQITSGTLSYAFGCGKAVVSTPYWHAEELLADGRGVLVPFRDGPATAEAIVELLSDEQKRNTMRKRAYILGREMTWNSTAGAYVKIFRETARSTAVPVNGRKLPAPVRPRYSPDALNHLRLLTDPTGLFQHAKYSFPNRFHGYCTDDNARALRVTALLEASGRADRDVRNLMSIYLSFLHFAFDPSAGRFHNFMSFDRRWLDESGSDDCQGRVLLTLGTVIRHLPHADFSSWAFRAFSRTLPTVLESPHLRSAAYAALGIAEYLARFTGDRTVRAAGDALGNRLLSAFADNSDRDWPWFEDRLTYANAVLPHALIVLGGLSGNDAFLDAGITSLRWLSGIQTARGGHFRPVGCHGFFTRGGTPAIWDQQPLDASASVSACIAAWNATKEDPWLAEAGKAFEWFLGRNDTGEPLADSTTGGCFDGLQPEGVNGNRGGEAAVSWLSALIEMDGVPGAVLPDDPGIVRADSLLFPGNGDGMTSAGRKVRKKDSDHEIS